MQNPKQQEKRNKRDREIKDLYPEFTLEEIGKRYGLTKVRVWQIIKGIHHGKKQTRKNK